MINGGIYSVNFTGHTSAEFQGQHPAIVIKNQKNTQLYYIIPLTTYTKERWEKYKNYLACRIKSTNSIALVAQMQIKPYNDIKGRFFNEGTPLVITETELSKVYKNLLLLIEKSLNKSSNSHKTYITKMNEFQSSIMLLHPTHKIDTCKFDFSYNQDDIELVYKTPVPFKYHTDFKHIINNTLTDLDVKYVLSNDVLKITIKNFKKAIDKQ